MCNSEIKVGSSSGGYRTILFPEETMRLKLKISHPPYITYSLDISATESFLNYLQHT